MISSHFIYVLTNCGILKWKKRLVVENLVFNNEKYICTYKRYKIKILCDDIIFPQTTTMYILLDNVEIKKYINYLYYSKSDIYTRKLYELLNTKNITEKYIIPFSIDYITDIKKRRSVKIKLLKKELQIID